jgi:drug/metabolite transporter (DMT)-like permease
MNLTSLLPILYGLGAAISWGAADFAGGLASRRSANALAVVFHAEWIGMVGVFAVATLSGQPSMSLAGWGFAMLAGAIGTIGLIVLYKAMAEGQMSIAAPVSALLAASLPVAFGSFSEGFPGWLTLFGFILALAAVWAISAGESGSLRPTIQGWKELQMPFLAGFGFGLYFILIHRAGQESNLWPLVGSRLGGMLMLLVYALIKRPSLRLARPVWSIVPVNAVLDVTANGLYILASQTGRLDVAAVLGSLYPGMTVLLAGLLLKERVNRLQMAGILVALAAICLIAL